ncbi:MAG: ABC transporter substrate-binding protein [Bacteroidota bacterium]
MPIVRTIIQLCCFLTAFSACQKQELNYVRLSSWVSSPSETALFEETLEDFRQNYPEVPFKYEPIPGNYSEKIQLMLGTYTAPDLFYLKGITAPSYMNFGILRDLTPSVEADTSFDRDDFYPFLIDAFAKEGKLYGIPKDWNPYVLFYNKKLFQEAGIDTLPTNWEELRQVARQLTKDLNGDGETDQYGLVLEPSVDMIMPFVFQNGGHFQNPDGSLGITDDPFVGALEFYHGLYKEGIATIPTDVGAGWNADAFGREIAAMAISGGWLLPFLKDNYPKVDYGVAFLPKGKVPATVAFTTAYAMPKTLVKEADAWTLMSYLTGRQGMKKWTSLGLALPSRTSVVKANGFDEHPVFKTFVESAAFARPFQVQYSERGFEEVVVALQAVFFTGKEPRQALEEVAKRIEKYKIIGGSSK